MLRRIGAERSENVLLSKNVSGLAKCEEVMAVGRAYKGASYNLEPEEVSTRLLMLITVEFRL